MSAAQLARLVLCDEVRQLRREMDVKVIPAPQHRRAELPVRDDIRSR